MSNHNTLTDLPQIQILNFSIEPRESSKLGLKVEFADLSRERLVSKQSWVPELVNGDKILTFKDIDL